MSPRPPIRRASAAGAAGRGAGGPRAEKRAKKKRRKERGADEPSEVVPFARSYPSDPELTRLLAFFIQGNYAAVRAGAEKLARESRDEAVAAAARDLRRRLDPEPTAIFLWAIGVALCLFLFGYYAFYAQ